MLDEDDPRPLDLVTLLQREAGPTYSPSPPGVRRAAAPRRWLGAGAFQPSLSSLSSLAPSGRRCSSFCPARSCPAWCWSGCRRRSSAPTAASSPRSVVPGPPLTPPSSFGASTRTSASAAPTRAPRSSRPPLPPTLQLRRPLSRAPSSPGVIDEAPVEKTLSEEAIVSVSLVQPRQGASSLPPLPLQQPLTLSAFHRRLLPGHHTPAGAVHAGGGECWLFVCIPSEA